MMSNIKVGEYVRTKRGYIAKLEDTDIQPNKKYYFFDETIYYDWGEAIDFLEEEEIERYIKAHSKNIIDLIEADDYVNGWKVLSVVSTFDKPDEIGIKLQGFDNLLYDIKIYSIVTKERMKNVEYRIERDMETN